MGNLGSSFYLEALLASPNATPKTPAALTRYGAPELNPKGLAKARYTHQELFNFLNVEST
jgi:hypothetical protein